MSYQRGVRPDYTVGTITLVSNSKNFTTVGASLKTATISSGDTIMTADGRVLIISEITGQNAGVLAYPCPASAAGANLPLRIRFQPSSSGVQGAVRDLLQRWGETGNIDALAGLQGYAGAIIKFTGAGTAELVNVTDIQLSDPNGNLAALSGVASAADTLAYFTGAGTADVTALTEWARTLLAAANGGKGYEALGGVPNASLPSRLTEDGGTLRSDPDNINATGWYRIAGNTAGMPLTGTFLIFHLKWSNNQARQFCYSHSGIRFAYERVNVSGTWSPWYKIYSAGNILDTVSVENNVPTGGIIQRGSNANGEFVRFTDGTQICTNTRNIGPITVATGNMFRTDSVLWQFPAVFATADVGYGGTAGGNATWCGATSVSASQVNTRQYASIVNNNVDLVLKEFAIGRWF